MPMRARKKIRVGISKTRPMPSSILMVRPKNSSTVMTALKSRAQVQEELAGEGEGDVIGEGRPAEEEDRGEEDERADVLLFLLVEARGDELPDLVEDERRDGEEGGHERDLDVEHEGLGQPEEGQLGWPSGRNWVSGRARKR